MRSFPFVLLVVAAFDTAIAVLLTLVGYGGTFAQNFVFSQCIGFSVVTLLYFGWRALWPAGRPPPLPFVALSAAASVAGWLAGSALAGALLGIPAPHAHGDAAALAITLAAGAIGTWFFWSRERATEMARLRVEAQLKLLQAQIEPHFLFNTLANLDALIATDPPRARVMLAHLNAYLRATLAAARRDGGTLADEFALLRGYLEVQALRMGGRLRFSLELPEVLAQAALPPMLLQPLVENALQHGLEPKLEGGEVRVRAREEAGRLVLEVSDTGLGSAHSGSAGSGVGLANVRERLAAAFGGRASLEAAADPAGGYRATLRLPR
jgi:signal transduction histidine kinase